MMNLFQLQEQLKDFSKDRLVKEMQSPSGTAPPYLVMTELQRRTRMENAAVLDKGTPTTTVAQDTVNAAGVPQGGIADMARALAPQTDMAQNTGAQGQMGAAAPQPVQTMQEGGLAGVNRNLQDYVDQMIDGPMSGVLLDVGPSNVSVPKRLQMGQRGGGSSDYTPRPEYADPEALGLAGDEIARMREVERAREIAANRGPRVSSMPTPTQSTLASLTADPIQNVPVDVSDESYIPPRIGATELNLPGMRQVLGVAAEPAKSSEFSKAKALEGKQTEDERRQLERQARTFGTDVESFTAGVLGETPQSYIPPRIGATELNLPGMRQALGVAAEPVGVDERNQRYKDLFSATSELGSNVAEELRKGATMLSPFATDQQKEELMGITTNEIPAENLSDIPLENLLPPALDVTSPDVVVSQPPGAGGAAPGAGGGAGGGLPAVPSVAPMSDQDRMLQQDKWLALARFGAALASSRAPTFGQAIGEAGQVGLDALGKARQDYLERKAAAEMMALKRAAMASKGGRGGGGGGGGKAPSATMMKMFDDEIDDLSSALAMAETPEQEMRIKNRLDSLVGTRDALRYTGLSSVNPALGATYAQSLAPQGGQNNNTPAIDVEGGTSIYDRTIGKLLD